MYIKGKYYSFPELSIVEGMHSPVVNKLDVNFLDYDSHEVEKNHEQIPSRTYSLPLFLTPRTYSLLSFFHPVHIPSRSSSAPDIFPSVINLKMPLALHPLITKCC